MDPVLLVGRQGLHCGPCVTLTCRRGYIMILYCSCM